MKSLIKMAAAFFIALTGFLFLPDRQAAEAVSEEFASAEQITAQMLMDNPALAPDADPASAAGENPPDTERSPIDGLRVKHYRRFGDKFTFTFTRRFVLHPGLVYFGPYNACSPWSIMLQEGYCILYRLIHPVLRLAGQM